jgi:hypothetical protein
MTKHILGKPWSKNLLHKFFDQAIAPFLKDGLLYFLDGEPLIQTLPENYHDHAQPTQPVTSTRSNALANQYAFAHGDDATEWVVDPATFEHFVRGALCTTIIDELPRWFCDAAARESAAGKRDTGTA